MKNKSGVFWCGLSVIVSFLATTYFWLAEGLVPKVIAEWVSAFGTVGAVGIALYIQFRNESVVKVENNLKQQNEVCKILLDDLTGVKEELNDVLWKLSEEFTKGNTSDDKEGVNATVLLIRLQSATMLSKKWRLTHMISEILNEEEQYEFSLALMEMSNKVLGKLDTAETMADLTSIMRDDPYQYIYRMVNIISEKYHRISSLSVIDL